MAITFKQYSQQSPERALEFLRWAYVRRSPMAALLLGKMYRDGDMVRALSDTAIEMFGKAILWSLTVPYLQDCHTRAIHALQSLSQDEKGIEDVEVGHDSWCRKFQWSYSSRPFIGSYAITALEIDLKLDDIFKGDCSYENVMTQLKSANYSLLADNCKVLMNVLDVIYKTYAKLCDKYNAAPLRPTNFDATWLYPYISVGADMRIVEDVAEMLFSLRATKHVDILPFSLALSDEEFLDMCEQCKEDDLQLFMISIIEAKIELDSCFDSMWALHKMVHQRDYEGLSAMLNGVKHRPSFPDNKLNFTPEEIENILPYDMVKDIEKGAEDDFDTLLEAFIASELVDTPPFEKSESPSNESKYTLQIEQIDVDYDFDTDGLPKKNGRTLFRQSDGENLHVQIMVENPAYEQECWGTNIGVELLTSGGVVLAIRELNVFCESDIQTQILSMTFTKLNLREGGYRLKVKEKGEMKTQHRFNVVDLPSPYTACIDFGGFVITRIEDDMTVGTDSHNCFDINGLGGVCVATCAENILPRGYQYQLITRIYNELGSEIATACNEDSVDDKDSSDKTLQSQEQITLDSWEKGTYRAEVEFLSEVIASVEFVVGERNITASFHKREVQPKTNIGGRDFIRSVENPMAQLDAMVGLEGIKKEIRLLMAKCELDKKRAMNGLKTKPISLHTAFLGNSGTGKSTVAKLLGQIYKDMGLLSSGHVVVEERSTLLGQNWGSEGDLTNKALEKAKGGILFIDEAYDLVTDHPTDPGRLIISTLLSTLADEIRRDWMLILAGYPAPMQKMLNANEGFRSRLQIFDFKDYTTEELLQVADLWLSQNDYQFNCDARKAFEAHVKTAVEQRDNYFGNARYVCDLLEKKIVPAMSSRIMDQGTFDSVDVLKTIEFADIPNAVSESNSEKSISKLEAMIGLGELKSKITSHLDFVRFVNLRRNNGISTTIPPLHMIFTGNPGTGKTTVADYLGEIYKSMGLLSVGRVVKVSRADMIGSYGDTERTMKTLLSAAKGNILFVDEAYTLFSENPNDPGRRAVEMLLDALSKESIDMIVIMAGYSKDMELLLQSNQGLTGRFPYKFEFKDYKIEELIQIAKGVCNKNNLILSHEAGQAIEAIIKKEYRVKDRFFSNARFVVRLITTQIMPNMGSRITKIEGCTDDETLKTVLPEDVPISAEQVKHINNNLFDEVAIEKALARLDALVGLRAVKRAIHEFVDISRQMSLQNRKFIGSYPLKWSFAGNTGTGKSTVAEILSEILKAMYLLGKGHLVEVKAEELYSGNTHQADELLKKRMKESQQGLLFVDGDAPQFRSTESRYNPDYLRMCLATNTIEMPGTYAIVIAEHESPRERMVQSLAQCGITDFDHTLIFEDYTAEELLDILKIHLSKSDLTIDADAEQIMQKYIVGLCTVRRNDYANARTMKLLARSIQKLTLLAQNNSGIIPAAQVAEFASSRVVTHKKIGY